MKYQWKYTAPPHSQLPRRLYVHSLTHDWGHPLSVFKRRRGEYYLVNDPGGTLRIYPRDWVAGPFKTRREAQVRYIILLNTDPSWRMD